MKYAPPSTSKTSFNCPHCHVLCTQHWHNVHADSALGPHNVPPKIPQQVDLENALKEPKRQNKDEEAKRVRQVEFFRKSLTRSPFLLYPGYLPRSNAILGNVFISQCYDCRLLSIWIHDSLYYPSRGEVSPANPDIPEEIRKDYDEASKILNDSPRGAAALLRLVVQKLCKELGGKGVNINDDIAYLVKNGLHPKIQKALDSVRIIGNEAVHPGQMDLITLESKQRLSSK